MAADKRLYLGFDFSTQQVTFHWLAIINLTKVKACPSSGKVVITAAPGIGYSAATGSGAQAALKWWCLQWEQRSRAKIPGNQLG